MTDNEIIKALEDMIEFADMVNKSVIDAVDVQRLKNALDLINRQQADIENYKQIAENQQSVSMDKEVEIKRLKAEVERLKERRDMWRRLAEDFDRITREEDLLKEMGVEG